MLLPLPLSCFVIATVVTARVSTATSTGLMSLSDCSCLGHVTSYSCTILGNGYTLWNGAAFDCPSSRNEILLSHSSFASADGTVKSCNDGLIVGRSLGVTGDYYTSKLDVNLTHQDIGRIVQCSYENGISDPLIVGSTQLAITEDAYPPPDEVRLLNVSQKLLTFMWNPVALSCASIYYEVRTSCGICPNRTSSNFAYCSISDVPNNVCEFSVRSVVCDDLAGNWSIPITVSLQVPEVPVITEVIASYGSDENKNLLNLDIKFNEVTPFYIFEGVDGSALFYTLHYIASSMGLEMECGSANVAAFSCLNGTYTATLPPACYLSNGTIKISVSASNKLGEGPTYTRSVATNNQYIGVMFKSANEVQCIFLNQMESLTIEKSCSITYGPCQQRLTNVARGSTSQNNVTLLLQPPTRPYCYDISAKYNGTTIELEGSYNDDKGKPVNTAALIVSIISVFIICVLLVLYIRTVKYNHKLHRIIKLWDISEQQTSEEHIDPETVEERQEYTKEVVGSTILTHIEIKLQDTPGELLKVLKLFKDLAITITDILMSAHCQVDNNRTVYIQCKEPELTRCEKELKKCIDDTVGQNRCQIFLPGTHKKRENVNNKKPPKFIGYEYTRAISREPGSLYELLQGIKKLSDTDVSYGRINIIDITSHPSLTDPYKVVVTLRFVSQLPSTWKEEFNRLRLNVTAFSIDL